jgi:hypothetical protein
LPFYNASRAAPGNIIATGEGYSHGFHAQRHLSMIPRVLSFQPSHAFCLNKIEETDSNNPPLALYKKKNIRSDPSAGCNFVKNTES